MPYLVVRSSVRPKTSKQRWGTILRPVENPMGFQRLTQYEVQQTVTRLHVLPNRRQPVYTRVQQADLTRSDVRSMVARLSAPSKRTLEERQARNAHAYKQMGVLNSYAWKGYYTSGL